MHHATSGYALAVQTELGGWRWTDMPAGWVLTLVAVGLFVLLRALYRAERGRAGTVQRVSLAVLRTVILLLVLLVLAGPYREEVRVAEERAHLVLLVDASGSMDTQDRYPEDQENALRELAWPDGQGAPARGETFDVSRLDLVKRVLAPAEGDETLLGLLDERFVLHAYAFAADWWSLGATREAAEVEGDESADPVGDIGRAIRSLDAGEGGQGGTNLGAVLRNVAGEYLGREDRRLAGVLLVSDGRDTSTDESPLEVLSGLGTTRKDLRVTAVALGNAETGHNVRVERIRALDVVLIGDRVVFETAIRQQGFDGLDGVRAEMTITKIANEEGNPVEPTPYQGSPEEEREVGPFRLGREDEPTPVRLETHLNEAGTFRVRIEAKLPPDAAEEDAIPTDDAAERIVLVKDQRIRVLVVDDRPRREFYWLSSWLTRDPEPDPTRPEARRRYETHALQLDADPTVEQRASPGVRPLRSFPRTRAELFRYDVVILGDVDPAKLGASAAESREMLTLVRDFVKEGGGLALISGDMYHNPLDLGETPLQELLPVNPREADENASEPADVPFRLALTDVGREHPIFGIVPGRDGRIATPEEVAKSWAGETAFSRDWEWYWLYRATGGLRPGAVDLATVVPTRPDARGFEDDRGRPLVVLATMGYGKGRVFWSALDSIWRLRTSRRFTVYGQFWDQIVRYLATYRLLGGNTRFKITTDKESYYVGETVTVTVTALDRDFEPLQTPHLDDVHLENPRGEDTRLEGDRRPRNMTDEGAAPGTYRAYLPVRHVGTHRIWIQDASGSRGRSAESRAELRFEAEYEVPELRQTIPDHDLLERIVRETGGRLIEDRPVRLAELPALARELPSLSARRVVSRDERTQWDRPQILLLLVALLGLEWFFRKRWQMI